MRDPNPRHRVLPAAFVLTGLALVAAIYGRGLHAPFVFDDVVFVDSPIVHITTVGQLPAIRRLRRFHLDYAKALER